MDFIWDEDINLITFDLIVDFDANRDEVKAKVLDEIRNKYPDYQGNISLSDISLHGMLHSIIICIS